MKGGSPVARLFGRKQQPNHAPIREVSDASVTHKAPEQTPGQVRAEQIANYRPGRPVAGADKRMQRVNLSLSADEYAGWKARAILAEVPLSRWVREFVAEGLEQRNENDTDHGQFARELAGVRTELRRIGSNLNQIARGFNTEANNGPPVDRAQALEELRAMRAEHEAIRAHLRSIEGQA